MVLLSERASLAAPLPGAVAYAEPSMAGAGDYLALMKPRVMSLVVFTALAGLVAAPGHMHPVLAFFALVCIAVGAGSAGAINMWYDADIDAVMTRTADRPVPAGRIRPGEALAFGLVLAGFSVVFLGLMINVLAAGLLAFTIFFYAVVYTIWLKRWTPQNIVIGGAAGAFPPVVGWAAATGGIGLESILLFFIIFFWTPPHFWALSLYRSDDYFRANIPMLPVVSGEAETRRQILLYSLVLAPIGTLPWLLGTAGLVYGAVAILGGLTMVGMALQLYRAPKSSAEPAARRLFAVSIVYLFVLFAALLLEHAVGLTQFGLPFGRVFA